MTPAQGYLVNVFQGGAGTEWFVVGPLAEGCILRRVRMFWSAAATTLLNVGIGLGGVNEASEVAFASSGGLIHPGSYVRHGKPAVGVIILGPSQGWFEVPCGVEIYSGSRYLVGFILSSIADAGVSVAFAVDCVEV